MKKKIRDRLTYLEQVAATEIVITDPNGHSLINCRLEHLYIMAKYGHEGRMVTPLNDSQSISVKI